MNFPGYTAEASLTGFVQPRRFTTAEGVSESGPKVVPQAIGCVSKTFGVGPLRITVKCCALPPGCSLRACAFGICKSFCLGACP